MAAKKKTSESPSKKKNFKRKKVLESPSDIIDDFFAGMKEDKEAVEISTLGDQSEYERIRGVLSTNSATLDAAIGRGGSPLSRIVIIHGREGSGKTTLALHLCAMAQRRGGIAGYADKEHKLDPDYAAKLGVDLKRLVKPKKIKTLESVISFIKAMIRRAREIRKKLRKIKGGKSRVVPFVIVIDSLNACKAFDSLETDTGKKRYPTEARIWSEELPEIAEEMATENVNLVFISQVRKKMNVKFGNDEEMAGGNAPRFYASLIMYVARIGTEKDGEHTKIGSAIEVECKKNQIAPPFKKARFTIYWNRGIDYEQSLLMQLESMGLVKKVKKVWMIGKIPLGKNFVQGARRLRAHPELRSRLIALFYKRMDWELDDAVMAPPVASS